MLVWMGRGPGLGVGSLILLGPVMLTAPADGALLAVEGSSTPRGTAKPGTTPVTEAGVARGGVATISGSEVCVRAAAERA